MNSHPKEDESLPWLPALLQTVDPLFPIGSYAHSYGLEELANLGIVTDEASLQKFMLESIAPGLEQLELPYLRFLYNAFDAANFDLAVELDEELHASFPSAELRQAHTAQGRQRLRLLRALKTDPPLLAALEARRNSGQVLPLHHTVFAAEKVASHTPRQATLVAWAYQAFAAAATASLKLIRIGQEGAQRALTAALRSIPRLVDASLEIDRAYAGCFNPQLDIASSRHQRAYSRLFIS